MKKYTELNKNLSHTYSTSALQQIFLLTLFYSRLGKIGGRQLFGAIHIFCILAIHIKLFIPKFLND